MRSLKLSPYIVVRTMYLLAFVGFTLGVGIALLMRWPHESVWFKLIGVALVVASPWFARDAWQTWRSR